MLLCPWNSVQAQRPDHLQRDFVVPDEFHAFLSRSHVFRRRSPFESTGDLIPISIGAIPGYG